MKSFDPEFLAGAKSKMEKSIEEFRRSAWLPWETNEVYRKCMLTDRSVVKPDIFDLKSDHNRQTINSIPVGIYD